MSEPELKKYEPTADDLAVLEAVRNKRPLPAPTRLPTTGGVPAEIVARAYEPQPGKDRLTVVENVYHQPAAGDATGTDGGWCAVLESDAQPYARKVKVGPEWQPLGYGWLDEDGVGLSQLCLRNVSVEPEAVVQLGIGYTIGTVVEPFAVVRPGRSCRFEPGGKLKVRCIQGQATIMMAAFPE